MPADAWNQNERDRDRDRPFELFISYARERRAVLNNLLENLKPYVRTGLIRLWTDHDIAKGGEWRPELAEAMDRCDGAILILCPKFLVSDWCRERELPHFHARCRREPFPLLPVLARDCQWQDDEILSRYQVLPTGAVPISRHKPQYEAYTVIAREIRDALLAFRARHGLARRAPTPPATPDPTRSALDALLAELPGVTPRLFGRESAIIRMDTQFGGGLGGVLLWVAPGGVGKSALTRQWLGSREWPPGTRFVGHSFYSQGSRDQTVSARAFLLRALAALDKHPEPTAADADLGRLLAECAAKAPTVLALDGLEPLQQASSDPKLNGRLKDQGLAALLEGLGRAPGQAVCLASSRLPIPDPLIASQPHFREVRLGVLPRPGSVALLEARGLDGTPAEFDAMAERCADHPLALVLAAELTYGFLDNRAAAFLARDWPVLPDQGPDRHAETVMGWLDAALRDEHAALDRALVRVLGLFDRPAPWGAILALKAQEPAIAGLTEPLRAASEAELEESLARLRQWGLAASVEGGGGGGRLGLDAGGPPAVHIDAHPLVREHFGRALEQESPAAWRAAHGVLFDWFRALPEQALPETLEGLEPLYRAVGHGCRAGRYAQATREVYRDRILRGNQSYSVFQLGAISADLSALSGFFPDGWSKPPVTGDLSESERSWLIGVVAFCLMSLGRLDEALGLRRMDRERWREAGDWNNFCISSNNLVDLLTPLGYWREAESVAREAVEAAGRVSDKNDARQRQLEALGYLGRALHGQGRSVDAAQAFAEAESVQAELAPHLPTLVSLSGFDYAQLLLEQARTRDARRAVLERARASLASVKKLLSIALDHCTIGQALAGPHGSATESDGQPRQAAAALDLAIETMRRANGMDDLPKLYLARARHRRTRDDPTGARADLDAAVCLATPSGMRTDLAECAVLAGHLDLDRALDRAAAPDAVPEAAKHWTQADRLIRETGYRRREAELHLLEARLKHHQARPAEARAALAGAESALRARGQWGLWPQLVQVAAELGLPAPVMDP
jgi:hypothetical protein